MEILKNQVQIDKGNSFYESNQPYSLFLLTIFFSIYHKCDKFHGVQKKRTGFNQEAGKIFEQQLWTLYLDNKY